MESLVVLGANPKVSAAAAALEVPVFHVQMPGERHPSLLHQSEEVFEVDFRNEVHMRRFTQHVLAPLRPTAVVSLTELGLEPAAIANEMLGTPGVGLSTVRATRDKRQMRDRVARSAAHLNPDYCPGNDAAGLARLFQKTSRIIVKPVDGSGSEGVRLLTSREDVSATELTPATVFEQYVGGVEVSVEALSRRGVHSMVAIAEKRTSEGFVELAHLMPPPSLTTRQVALVEGAVAELLDSIGILDGPSHTEVKVNGTSVIIIETHNRLGGDGIADLVSLTSGIDWRRAALEWPLDRPLPRLPAVAAAAAAVFFVAPPGRVASISSQPKMACAEVVEWEVTKSLGEVVAPLRSSSDRLGHALITAADVDECAASVQQLLDLNIVQTTTANAT